MAWTTPKTFTTGDVITAADGNTYIRDNTQYLYDERVNMPSTTVQGDFIYFSSSGGFTRLPPGTTGYILQTNGTGAAPTWVANPDKIFRIGHTYTIPGELRVPSSQDDYIPPFFVSLATGQSVSLAAMKHVLNKGTSITVKMQRNGVDLSTAWQSISVTTSATLTDSTDVSLSDGDSLQPVVTAVSTDTPKNLSLTIFLDYTQ